MRLAEEGTPGPPRAIREQKEKINFYSPRDHRRTLARQRLTVRANLVIDRKRNKIRRKEKEKKKKKKHRGLTTHSEFSTFTCFALLLHLPQGGGGVGLFGNRGARVTRCRPRAGLVFPRVCVSGMLGSWLERRSERAGSTIAESEEQKKAGEG
jgi:hypothetical protein